MKLPKKIEKEKKKRGEDQSPPSLGGRALERLHQFERERGLPETILKQPDCDANEQKEKSGESD